ncbi:MAG: DUF2314 domain-containing protein, partial [Polyangiales bacterium]
LVGANDGQDPQLVLHTSDVARAVAQACHGWVVDLDLNRVLPVAEVANYFGATFDARDMIMLHQVSGENDLGFIDSEGLARVGLPEIFVADVPSGYAVSVGRMLNATAQTLVERGDLTRDGALDVDVSNLTGDWHLEDIKKDGGNGVIHWKVRWSKPADSHDDPLLELFIEGHQPGSAVALLKAIESYEGAEEDKVQHLDFQPELDAAAVKARAALGALRAHFAKGMPFDERLSIKAPFKTDDGEGNEWMWVDVFTFKGNVLEGTLANTPNSVSSLQLGARVKVKFTEVADFIHRRADKTNAGGFSLDVMRQHGMDVPALADM